MALETRLEIDELMPVALVVNEFMSESITIKHHGIAFIARTDGKLLALRHVETKVIDDGDIEISHKPMLPDSGLEARFTTEIPERMAFHNREVLEVARQKLSSGVRLRAGQLRPERHPEVLAAEKKLVRFAKFVHRHTLKPFLHFFASRRVRSRILHSVAQPMSFLDAAAGDDTLVCRIAMELTPKLCVANDICWRDMEPLRRLAHAKKLNMVFTNHNADRLPYAVKFDVVLFKNALHHARSAEEAELFLNSIKNVAKRLIIIDVEDPRRRALSKLFNWYYTYLLHDEGHRFCDWGQFRSLIQLCYGNASFELVKTIKGRYMIAIIQCEELP